MAGFPKLPVGGGTLNANPAAMTLPQARPNSPLNNAAGIASSMPNRQMASAPADPNEIEGGNGVPPVPEQPSHPQAYDPALLQSKLDHDMKSQAPLKPGAEYDN